MQVTTTTGRRANGHGKCRYMLYAVLLVFLTFPLDTHQFNFFGSDDERDSSAAATPTAAVRGKQISKRPVERKFKFRKIERIYADDERALSNDEDDDADERENANNGDDNDDEDAQRSEQERSDNERENNASADNEEEEYQFERARKAHKERRADPKTSAQQKDERPAMMSSFFGDLFGGESAKSKRKNTKKARTSSEERGDDQKSNGIIDWLKWLGEKSAQKSSTERADSSEQQSGENWMSYLNRWPFNTIFPIGQPEKPIRMPRRNGKGKSKNDSHADPPISQEHFESLLHTLPGFVMNADRVADIDCRQQLQVFYRQLRGNKLWTLQMLDATGKISSGILRGNANQFGDFDMCTHIKTLVKVTPEIPMRVRGKYCLAHIETQTDVPDLKVAVHLAHGRGLWNSHLGNPSHFAPRYSVTNFGICVPNMCSGEMVQQMMEYNLRAYNSSGVYFHIEVDENDCYVRQSRRITKLLKKDSKFAATLSYIALLALMVMGAFVYDSWTHIKDFTKEKYQALRKPSAAETPQTEEGDTSPSEIQTEDVKEDVTEEPNVETEPTVESPAEDTETATLMPLKLLPLEMFKAFSPSRTLADLLSTDRLDSQLPVVHVLKLLATFMLYLCLKYIMLGHLPISNREKLVRAVDQPSSILFRAPIIYMDVLLLLSGFLASYSLSMEMEKKSYIQLLKRMASKMCRYLPTVYVLLCFQTWIMPHLDSGPMWSKLIGENTRLCEQQMWRNLFNVQNAIDFEETCSPMTIQLGLEVQLFLLGPLLVWLYYTDSDAGFFVYGAIHAMSVASRYSRTKTEHLSMTLFHGMNVSKFYRTANLLYSSPLSRATPYLLGIGAGIFQRSQPDSLEISAELLSIGWLLAALSVLWCFWDPSSGMRSDFVYSSSDAAAYSAWCPLIMGLALCWLILMFPKGEGSIIRFLTTSRPILFLSRIAFPMQLVTYVVVVYNTARVKDIQKYQFTDLINFNEIGSIVLFAMLIAFLIDTPSQNIRRLLVERLFVERPHDEHEVADAECENDAELEVSEEIGQEATAPSATPEPVETVWSSDPEEEEQRYLNRRRSSLVIEEAVSAVTEEPKHEEEEKEAEEVEEEEEDEEEEEEVIVEKEKTPPPATVAAPVRRRRPLSDD